MINIDNYIILIETDGFQAAGIVETHLYRKRNRRSNFVKNDGGIKIFNCHSCHSYTTSGCQLNFAIVSFNFVTCLQVSA